MRVVQGDPLKILVGTSILTLLVSLDGDGSTTYLMSRRHSCRSTTTRPQSPHAGECDHAGRRRDEHPAVGRPNRASGERAPHRCGEIFVPMIPAMIAGAAWVVFVAYMFGKRERARVGVLDAAAMARVEDGIGGHDGGVAAAALRRPRLLPLNFALDGCDCSSRSSRACCRCRCCS